MKKSGKDTERVEKSFFDTIIMKSFSNKMILSSYLKKLMEQDL